MISTIRGDLAAALKEEATKEMARRNLLDYCRLVDPKYQTDSNHIVFLADLLQRADRRELDKEKIILTIMPRSGKSRLLSHYAAFLLGRNEGKSLLLLSASQSLATRNSRWIRDDVLSPNYPWDISIDDTSSSILAWRTSNNNEVRVFSTGSILTGHAASLAILADDIQPDAMTTQTRDGLETWLRSVLESRRDPDCPLIILQNRWSTDDIVQRLAEGPDGDTFEVLNIEAICSDSASDPLQRSEGESVWPSRWPVELLEKKKKSVGSHVWESSYQGRPTPEGGRLIDIRLFKDYEALPTPSKPQWDPLSLIFDDPLKAAWPNPEEQFVKVVGIDTSGVTTTTTTGSWNAWVTCILDTKTGNVYVTHCERARNISFEELRQKVLLQLGMSKPDLAVIENASQGGRLAESLRGMTQAPIQLVEPRQSKEQRVINVLPLLEGGKIYIPKAAAWREIFLKELADFPASRTSDITDAWAYAVTYCKLALARRAEDDLFEEQIKRLEGGWMFRI